MITHPMSTFRLGNTLDATNDPYLSKHQYKRL